MLGKNYNLDNQYTDAVKAEMPPQMPMSMLSSSVDSLKILSTRLTELADHLTGSEPESGGKSVGGSLGGGLFGEVERFASDIDDMVGTMARHLSRIERRL